MDDETAYADDFRSSLTDLTSNSKPHISMLTELAEENSRFSKKIVQVIEAHLHTAPPTQKLPCLYLIDSIIKNVDASKGNYKELFGRKMSFSFCEVFEKVDEKTRMAMFKLRNTWPDLFDNKILYAIDVGANRVDPAWPITAPPPPNVHINPKFLLKNQQDLLMERQFSRDKSDDDEQVVDVRHLGQLYEQKQKELALIEQKLQQQAKELELQKQKRLQEQELIRQKSIQIEQERRLQAELREQQQQRDMNKIATKQATIAKVVSSPKVSAVVAPSSRDPRNRDVNDTKTEQQTAIVLPTISRPFPTTNHSEPTRAEPGNIFERFLNHPPTPLQTHVPTPAFSAGIVEPVGTSSASNSFETSLTSEMEDIFGEDTPTTDLSNSSDLSPEGTRTRPVVSSRTDTGSKGLGLNTSTATTRGGGLSINTSKQGVLNASTSSKLSTGAKSPRLSKFLTRTPPNLLAGGRKEKADAAKRKGVVTPQSSEGSNEVPKVVVRGGGRVRGQKTSPTSPRQKRLLSGTAGDTRNTLPTKKIKLEGGSLLSDELKMLFGDEDQDYRQLPQGEGGASATGPPIKQSTSPPLRPPGWSSAFKTKHSGEFPYSAAQPAPLHRGPLLPTPQVSAEPVLRKSSSLLPLPVLDESMQVKQAERLAQIQEMRVDLDAKRERLEHPDVRHEMGGDQPNSPKRYKKRYEGDGLLPAPHEPPMRFRSNMSAPALLPTPPIPSPLLFISPAEKMNRTQLDNHRPPPCPTPPSPVEFWVAPATPWYDNVQFYVPEHDPRWLLRAKDFNTSGQLGSRASDTYGVVIDGRHYDMTLNNRPHRIPLNDIIIEVRLDPDTRQLWIDDVADYKLGDDELIVEFNGRRHSVSARGPVRKLWIDLQQFEINVDSPAEKINIGGREHKIRIDGKRNYIVVDGYDICPFGGEPQKVTLAFIVHTIQFVPPCKQILIDGDLCNLDLAGRYPAVVVNNTRRGIRFDGPAREIFVDDRPWSVPMTAAVKWRIEEGLRRSKPRLLAFGGPGHELIIDDQWYEVKFGGESKFVRIGGVMHKVELRGCVPDVKILGEMVPADELGRVTRGVSRPEAARGLGYNSGGGGVIVDKGQPRPPPAFMGFRPDLAWKGPPAGSSFGEPCRPAFNAGPLQRPVCAPALPPPRPPVMLSMSYPPPMIFPDGSSVWSTNQGPQQTVSVVASLPPPSASVDVSKLLTQLLAAGIIQTNKDPVIAAPSSSVAPPVVQAPTSSVKVKNEPQSPPRRVSLDEISKTLMRLAGSSSDDSTTEMKHTPRSEETTVLEPVPDLTELELPSLRKKYSGVVASLHVGVPCTLCGMRFKPEELDTVYKEHLDWHFRMNKKLKEGGAATHSRTRGWHYDAIDWIQYEELIDAEERDASAALEEGIAGAGSGSNDEPLPTMGADIDERPTASGDEQADTCAVCREAFEQFWDEEAEAWRLKDAVRYCGTAEGGESEGLAGRTYHRICFEDASKETADTSVDDGEGGVDDFKQEPIDDEILTFEAAVDEADEVKFTPLQSESLVSQAEAVTETTATDETVSNIKCETLDVGSSVQSDVIDVVPQSTTSSTGFCVSDSVDNMTIESTDHIDAVCAADVLETPTAEVSMNVDTAVSTVELMQTEDIITETVDINTGAVADQSALVSADQLATDDSVLSAVELAVDATSMDNCSAADETVLLDESTHMNTEDDKDLLENMKDLLEHAEHNGANEVDVGLYSSVEMSTGGSDATAAVTSVEQSSLPSGDASVSWEATTPTSEEASLSDLKQCDILSTTTTSIVTNPM